MREFFQKYDLIDLIFAIGLMVAGIFAIWAQDEVAEGVCLGAAATYLKGSRTPKENL